MASAATKNLAEKMGYLDALKAAGGDIAEDTCMDQPCWKFLYGKKGITDSPKCAYYTQRRNMAFVIRDIETCVDAALAGKV
jgi:predicted aconitase